jgi:hypothetical protein
MRRDGDDQDTADAPAPGGPPADSTEGVPDALVSVVAALDDPCARAVLVLTADRARSADELAAQTDASRATVYRRINDLVDLDLLTESQELDPDGNHFKTYQARLERVTIDLNPDGFELHLERREVEDDAVARLNRLTERLKRS